LSSIFARTDGRELLGSVGFVKKSLLSTPARLVAATLSPDAIKFANSDAAVQWYLDHGVPPAKIVLGLPFYGQVWASVPDEHNGLFEPCKGSPEKTAH